MSSGNGVNPRSRSVAIVGGGFGGVGAAAMLARAGYEDVTVFEKDERVGGVWQHNTYPGAACDIPSHLYEFSFAPNRWSRRFSSALQTARAPSRRCAAGASRRLSSPTAPAPWGPTAPTAWPWCSASVPIPKFA